MIDPKKYVAHFLSAQGVPDERMPPLQWRATFEGREVDAIGVFGMFDIVVTGDDERAARLAIYETHEHLSRLTLTPVVPGVPDALIAAWDNTITDEMSPADVVVNTLGVLDAIGGYDSINREALFIRATHRFGWDYDLLYDAWLDTAKGH